jgi:outer membrane protein assembly factor BamB
MALALSGASAQEWTRFRGPNGQGRIDAPGIPVQWTEADTLWRTALPDEGHSSPVIWGDRVFIACWDIQNGKTVWEEKTSSRFYGSPIAVGQRLYCINTKGEVLVLQAGDTFQWLATIPLGEKSQATPAVAGGKLYLRTLTSLICVAGRP